MARSFATIAALRRTTVTSRAVRAALAEETIRRRYEEVGFAAQASTPGEFTDKVRAEEARWKRLIDERGLKVD